MITFGGPKYANILQIRSGVALHTNILEERLLTGAVRVWGKVGEVAPPRLVLPLSVEPSKPRLCIDARFLNLWMRDSPFSLDKLRDVPRYVYRDSLMSTIDDKSGYNHVLLTEESMQYFGIRWGDWWMVCATLPFDWKNSPFVYQTLGLLATHFFRNIGIACSFYIDDRLNGEIFTNEGYWSRPITERDAVYSTQSAEAGLFIVCKLLIHLGYFLGLGKCVLRPTNFITYLGIEVNSSLQAFQIPVGKKVSFAVLREEVLGRSVNMGKAISFSLAFPGAKFFIREMATAAGLASGSGLAKITPALREEILFWRFLDVWTGHVPWRLEKYVAIEISTDASQSRWAGVIHRQPTDLVLGDFWEAPLTKENINIKEFWAVAKVLEALPAEIRDCRVHVQVDNQAVLHTWWAGVDAHLACIQLQKGFLT